ncbi:MAG TPA: hypothetical protein VMU05_05190 [Dongiaceae bacterium]|nr:hypothetical protein [Dongiaceae bacterium]
MRTSVFGALFRNPGPLFFAILVLLAAADVLAQTEVDRWLILGSGAKELINIHTTRADLVRLYGSENVLDQDADVGDGEIQPETILFPTDPERRIEILWKNPEKRSEPSSISIRGKKSRWHAVHGVSLGMTCTELEHINGRPFRFALLHDGTDMAEETISWQGGFLEKEFQGNGRIILSLEWTPPKITPQRGPRDFEANSDDPVWRAQNPHISEMNWVFPTKP